MYTFVNYVLYESYLNGDTVIEIDEKNKLVITQICSETAPKNFKFSVDKWCQDKKGHYEKEGHELTECFEEAKALKDYLVCPSPKWDFIMSVWLIVLTGLIYLFVAFEQGLRFGNIPMATMYAGYAVANGGLVFMASR